MINHVTKGGGNFHGKGRLARLHVPATPIREFDIHDQVHMTSNVAAYLACTMDLRASFVLLTCLLSLSYCQVPVNKNMKSFSSAIKGGKMQAGVEKTLYETSGNQPGVITEQWFTGNNSSCNPSTVLL